MRITMHRGTLLGITDATPMVDVYDREKTAALLKEARDITAGLKTEIGEIATHMSRVLDGGEEGTGAIEGTACNELRKGGAGATSDPGTGARTEAYLAVLAVAAPASWGIEEGRRCLGG